MFSFNNPFVQIKRKQRWNTWGNQQNNQWGNNQNQNNQWNNAQNLGWNNQQNNNWGNNNNNQGWGNNQNYGWQNNNNTWGNNNQNQNTWGNNLIGQQWLNQQNKRQHSQFQNIQLNDIKKYVEQQIVFIEPSPHHKILEELKQKGLTFKDERFPPNQQSLSGQWGYLQEWKQIKWKSISQVLPGAKIFEGKVEPRDIRQGYLGDCYFLAALAALAERPDRIYNLFLLAETNSQKYYSVKMLYKGKWLTIDMDEYVPFLYGEPAFTKSQNKQLWVVLLEKAWAKLYSSYKRIQAGYPEEGLHDLTGAPIKNIYMQQSSFKKEQEWEYLVNKAGPRDYAMVASSQPGSDTTKSFSGIVQGHAYTFLNAIHLNFKGQQKRIVQLRNPWGKGQFKGQWSDFDTNWNYIDQGEKRRVGFNPNKEDGIFFMSYDDFCKEFRALTIAQINDNASYVYKSFKDPQNKGCYFKLKIFEQNQQKYSLQVDHTPERSYEDKLQNSFRYPLAEIQIARLNGNSIGQKTGTTSSKRTLYYAQKLTKGEYIVYVKVHYDSKFEKDFDINLAVYSQFASSVSLATAQEADLFAGRNVDWSGQQTKTNSEWNDLRAYTPNQSQNEYNNEGWGNSNNNNNWGNSANNNNDGWGNPNNNGGWGNQNNNNNGWGNQNQGNNNNNNGWGNGW